MGWMTYVTDTKKQTIQTDRLFWITIRQALLLIVSAIERMLCITPTTAECRDKVKNGNS